MFGKDCKELLREEVKNSDEIISSHPKKTAHTADASYDHKPQQLPKKAEKLTEHEFHEKYGYPRMVILVWVGHPKGTLVKASTGLDRGLLLQEQPIQQVLFRHIQAKNIWRNEKI